MSARDYKRYHQPLAALHGRKSFVTVATNSIKLHIDEDKEDGRFLWFDPPWEFRRHGTVIETSASCPDHTSQIMSVGFERGVAASSLFLRVASATSRPARMVAFGSHLMAATKFLFLKMIPLSQTLGMIIGIIESRRRPNPYVRCQE